MPVTWGSFQPVVSMAPRAEGIDLVYVPKVVIKSVKAEQDSTPVSSKETRLDSFAALFAALGYLPREGVGSESI